MHGERDFLLPPCLPPPSSVSEKAARARHWSPKASKHSAAKPVLVAPGLPLHLQCRFVATVPLTYFHTTRNFLRTTLTRLATQQFPLVEDCPELERVVWPHHSHILNLILDIDYTWPTSGVRLRAKAIVMPPLLPRVPPCGWSVSWRPTISDHVTVWLQGHTTPQAMDLPPSKNPLPPVFVPLQKPLTPPPCHMRVAVSAGSVRVHVQRSG